jgi:cell division protein FtsI/penicillin-binding protein 2
VQICLKRRVVAWMSLAALSCACVSASASSAGDSLALALRQTQASGVVVDMKTGMVIASEGMSRRGAPGSTIKPLLLEYALEHSIVRPETEVYCHRNLHVGGRALPCTHPADHPVFIAESALAESCNTWFAEMARRFSGTELEAALQATFLPHKTMAGANVEQRQLAVLGLDGVSTSPIELARAYRDLLQRAPRTGPVVRGLEGSVNYGMANPAAISGVTILGKTGTASNAGEPWTHGWFAGAMPGRFVVVVYVPHGDGGTAARLAQTFFRAMSGEGKSR